MPIIPDTLTGCIVGGFLTGFGTGLILRAGSSGGGQDTLGMICLKKWPNFSVGRVSLVLNIFVYGICLICFDINVTVYSLIYAFVMAVSCDRVHLQNINISAMIFTKKPGVDEVIMRDLGRGVTEWDGRGSYTKEDTKVYAVLLSKYEQHDLIEKIHTVDPDAFIMFTEGAHCVGNYEKRLS